MTISPLLRGQTVNFKPASGDKPAELTNGELRLAFNGEVTDFTITPDGCTIKTTTRDKISISYGAQSWSSSRSFTQIQIRGRGVTLTDSTGKELFVNLSTSSPQNAIQSRGGNAR